MPVTTIQPTVLPGPKSQYIYEIDQSSLASTSDILLAGAPKRGAILSTRATLLAGTGTTLSPGFGLADAFTEDTQAHLANSDQVGAHVRDQVPLLYYSADRELYLRFTFDDPAADHRVQAEVIILEDGEL
jgi:hypothetical protein